MRKRQLMSQEVAKASVGAEPSEWGERDFPIKMANRISIQFPPLQVLTVTSLLGCSFI